MPETPSRHRSNYSREKITLTLQPRGARPRSAGTRSELPQVASVDINSTFPGASSKKKETTPRALPAVPPVARPYAASSTESTRRVRPLPLSPALSSDSSSSSSTPSLSSLSLSTLSLSPSPLFESSLPPSLSLTLSTSVSPTVSAPSPILFASRNACAAKAGVKKSPFGIGPINEFVRHKIRHDTSDSEDEDDDDDDTTLEEENNESTHHRWKPIWLQPITQDPPKKWVTETAKGQRTTVKDYSSILNILRAL